MRHEVNQLNKLVVRTSQLQTNRLSSFFNTFYSTIVDNLLVFLIVLCNDNHWMTVNYGYINYYCGYDITFLPVLFL